MFFPENRFGSGSYSKRIRRSITTLPYETVVPSNEDKSVSNPFRSILQNKDKLSDPCCLVTEFPNCFIH